MKRGKIFCIGAVVLMLLVAFSPAIDSIQTIKERNTKALGDGIYAEIERCEFVGYTLGKAKYEVDWYVCQQYPYEGSGDCVLKVGDHVFDTWKYHFAFGEYEDFGTQTLYLKSSEIPSVDEERYFAGNIVAMEVLSYQGSVLFTACNFAKHWIDEEEYIPTDPQVEASAPHWYNKMYCVPEIPDLYYLDFFDVRILPNILQSERMGWVGQASKYLAKIGADVAAIIGSTVAFLYTIKDDIKVIMQWIIDFIEWFASAINGVLYGGAAQLIYDFISYVIPAVTRIVEKGVVWGGSVLLLVNQLNNAINSFYEWTLDNPLTKPITISGRIDNVADGEVVTVHCRNETRLFTDDDRDGKIFYNIIVTSENIGNEQFQAGPHNCQVLVFGSKHSGESKSGLILSYAFANGSLYWHFTSPGDTGKTDNKPSLKKFLLDKFKNLFKNGFISAFFEKLQKKIEEKSEPVNTREFDIDELMKNVKEEHYEPYDGLTYKPYYPGAPRDSNIVYYSSDQVIVGFKSNVDITQIDEVEGYPVVDKIPELNTVIVEIYGIDPEEFIGMIENLTDVEYAELNYVYQTYFTPNDPLWDSQWGPKAIKCPAAWDIEKGSSLVSVAIVDTGCNYNHEDIKCKESYVNYDFVNNDDNPMDDNGHGTHCAGIVGGTMNNELGIAGVSQSFTDYIKVLDGSGAGYASTVAKGIIHAAKSPNTVDIISMSLGGYGLSVMVHAACDYAYYIRGVLLVAAAGNDGLPRVGYPARFDSVMAVGAVDENLKLCSWSNYGPDIDLVAPGNNIISTIGDDQYEKLSGTSMACPHVAGVAALYFSRNSDATAALCKGKLLSTAEDLGSPGKDIYYGYGLVNAYGAVNKNSITEDGKLQFFYPLLKLKQFFINSQIIQQILKTLLK